jgi:hypothetical protein
LNPETRKAMQDQAAALAREVVRTLKLRPIASLFAWYCFIVLATFS